MRMRFVAGTVAGAALCMAVAAGSAAASDVEGVRAKFREMDTNGDRALQFSEISAARARMFDRMDVNGNAVIDADEMATLKKLVAARQAEGALARIDLAELAGRIDANHDSIVSRAEFAAYIPERLLRADANGDRKLSLRELRALKRDREAAQKVQSSKQENSR